VRGEKRRIRQLRQYEIELRRVQRDRERSESLLREVAARMGRATSLEFVESLGRSLTRALDADFAFVSETVPDDDGRLLMCTFWERDRRLESQPYELAGTPCSLVFGREPRCWPDGVAEAFPGDAILRDLGIASYAGAPLLDKEGEPLGVIGVMHREPLQRSGEVLALLEHVAPRVGAEIERLRVERRLRESDRRHRALLAALPDLVFRLDREGRHLDYHVGAGAQLFVSPREFLGKRVAEVLPEPCAASLTRAIHDALDSGELQTVEYDLEMPNGRRDFEARLVECAPDEVMCFVRDVTERRRAERRRLESQRLESLGRLAGGIAHEFNNLLVGILGNAGLVQRELAPTSAAWEHMRDLDAAARRAADLSRQMLAFSGRGHFELRPVDLDDVVEEMRPLLPLTLPRGAELVIENGSRLPPVEADAAQMRQLVLALVTNAGEALGDGGRIAIRTGISDVDRAALAHACGSEGLEPGRYAFLEVEDDGAGMDPETVARAVEPFFSTRAAGRGLGLSAAIGIARGHGGALDIRSAPARGTRVRLLLPVSPAAGEAGFAAIGGRPGRAGAVLVVDDEEMVRGVLRRMLETLDFRVVEAVDGDEALAAMREHGDEVATVFLDMTMPRRGGEEVFRELKRRYPDLHVVFMSGYDEDTATGFAARAERNFLQKPFTLEQVRAHLPG